MNEITEDDLQYIQEDIHDWIDEYLTKETIKMSSPHFHKNLIQDITQDFYEYWKDCELCEEEDFDEIEEIMDALVDIYFDIYEIPQRSISYQLLRQDENNQKTMAQNTTETDKIAEKIAQLKSIPQAPQKSQEWYQTRHEMITASNIWKALNSEAQRNSLIFEKCKPFDATSSMNGYVNTASTLHWGVKYEPLSIMVYEDMYQTKIQDFGCIPHSKYNFIGSSPDGINVDPSNKDRYGRMIEIKNIYNREITGIPKEEYWIQCQIQMETCDLNECDFIETRFKEYENRELFYGTSSSSTNETQTAPLYKGVILHFIQRTNTFSMDASAITAIMNVNTPVYKYMPIDVPTDEETVERWIETTKELFKTEMVLFHTIYWYLDEISCVFIERNRRWFEAAVPLLEETWNTIKKERIEGYTHRASKKRVKTEVVVVETATAPDDEENPATITNKHYIKNLPLSNYVCLVKLDSEGNRYQPEPSSSSITTTTSKSIQFI